MTAIAKRVLVTNDDGIDADGLQVLVKELLGAGHTPFVVAPNRDYSGAGTSMLGLAGPSPEIAFEKRVLEGAEGVEAYAVDGPPALCVILAMKGAFGELPEVVASGINYGLNTGPAVTHSGTVAAAITAARWNVPSVAISAEFDWQAQTPPHYDTAAVWAIRVLNLLRADTNVVINLNVPCVRPDDLLGVREAPLAPSSRYQSSIDSIDGAVVKLSYAVNDDDVPGNSDTGLIRAGYAAITRLGGVSSLDGAALMTELVEAAV